MPLHAEVQPEVSKVDQPGKVHAMQTCRPEFNSCLPSGRRDLIPKKLHTYTQQQQHFVFKSSVPKPVSPASFLSFKGLSSEASTIAVLSSISTGMWRSIAVAT